MIYKKKKETTSQISLTVITFTIIKTKFNKVKAKRVINEQQIL